MKFHINLATGDAGKCSAKPGGCPFGSDDEHYSTQKEAREAYEKSQNAGSFSKVKKEVPALSRREIRAAKHTVVPPNRAPSKYTVESLKNAVAYAELHGTPTIVSREYEQDLPEFSRDMLDDSDGWATPTIVATTDTIANPDGSVVSVKTVAWVEGQEEDRTHWEFHPGMRISYNLYKNAADSVKAKRGETVETVEGDVEIDYQEAFRSRSGLDPDYNKWDFSSAKNSAENNHKVHGNPIASAKIAYLKNSPKRIQVDRLLGPEYFESHNSKVRAATVGRKEFPKTEFKKVLQDKHHEVVVSLASRPDLDRATEDAILEYKPQDPFVSYYDTPKVALMRNPKSSPAILNKFAREGTADDLHILSENPGIPERAKATIRKRVDNLGLNIRI